MKKKNGTKKVLLIVGVAIIIVGIIIIAIFMLNGNETLTGTGNADNSNADMVCTLEASIGETINVNNEVAFTIESNRVISSRITSTMTTTDVNDETFIELRNYNSQLLENNQVISDMYRITTADDRFTVEENITYNEDSNNLSLDISQMRANLLIPDYDSNTDLDNIRKEYQDYGYSCE